MCGTLETNSAYYGLAAEREDAGMLDKRFACTAAALALVVMAAVVAVSLPDKRETIPLQETLSDVEKEEEQQGPMYILREYEGRIGVFIAGEAEPETVLDVLVKYLPEYDREQMRQGIPAGSYNELTALIEDYSS